MTGIPQVTLADADVEFEKRIRIEIKAKKSSQYRVVADVEVKNKYLSKRSTGITTYFIPESHFAQVKDVKARRNGKRLPKDHVTETYPGQIDAFFSEQRLLVVNFPGDIRKGQDILYAYRELFDDISYLPPVWIPNKNRLKKLEVSVSFPEEVEVEFDFFFPWGPIEYSPHSGEQEVCVRFEDIDWVCPPVNFPYGDTRGAILIKATADGRQLNPVTANSFTEWYGLLTDLEPSLDSADSAYLSAEIPGLTSTPRVLEALVDYATENLRHISDGSPSHYYAPHDPAKVLRQKYGDCKDYANLVAAAARANGVDVHMVLISKLPYRDFPGVTPTLFDHVIVGYREGDETAFHDPTAGFTKFGDLPENLVGAMALVLDPDQPRVCYLEGGQTLPTIELTIDSDPGSLDSARTRIRFSGDYRSVVASARVAMSRVDLDAFLSGLVGSKLYKIALRSFGVLSENEHSIVCDAVADLRGFIIRSSPRTYLPRTPFIIADGNILRRAADDMGLYFEGREDLRLQLTLDDNDLQATPDSMVIDDGYGGAFSARLVTDDSTRVAIDYRYRRPAVYYEGDSKDGQMALNREYFDARNEMFILTEQTE